MNFVDFYEGQVFELGPVALDEASIIAFATQFDPQSFHVDRAAAAKGQWKGVIASGWHTCGIAMRLVVDHVLSDSDSFASPGLEYVKWPAPVRAGDRLSLRLEVLDVRRSRSGEYGILRWRWLMTNERDAVVLDLIATSLFGGPRAPA